jgi:hypothetical protein
MAKSDFKEAINELTSWHAKYEPFLYVPAADEGWVTAWGLLEKLGVPADHVWVNFDDGEGACFLSSFEDAPLPEKVSYIAVYVTKKKNEEESGLYLLTDQDVECESCAGGDEECDVCGGTGIEWLELDNPANISRDPNLLSQYFA